MKSQNVKHFGNFFAFLEKGHLAVKFRKIMFRSFSSRTPIDVLCSNVVKFDRWEIGEIVLAYLTKNTKKYNFAWLSSCR